ncbi:hypothetical protein F5876DRAFT_31318 [Lentinula aff. lateritia]|uniref:Uncharacterized protein n=1 Tax=Lentinula aff. lateritia TaxID=2804960 RepID=A0ACC1UF26_9AGAR|nr:hypothetical protein F5876DRAFT_31318 [Lentinula aff. lateritia]
MLSAIAARKAATAAAASGGVKSNSHSTSASTSTVSTSISTPTPKSKPRPTPSKRKHSSTGAPLNGSITAKKRRRREKDVLEKPRAPRSRYFEQGGTAATEGEDDEEDWDGSNSDVKVETTATRGYSPSRPISPDDSSDEEQIQNGSIQPEPQTQTQSQVLLTTFVPIPGQNTFYLSPDELSLVLSSQKSTVPATLIALGPSKNLTLLGTYRLTVIRGSIEIGGAILRSRVHPETHNVFAPRSSPVPSIHVVSSTPSSPSPALLPLGIQHEIAALVGDPVLILLQELRSGVEALGKVCRTFDGVFEVHPRDVLNHNRELEEEAEDVLRLRAVRIITHQSKYVSPLVIPPSWEKALYEVSTHDDDDSETERKHSPNIYLIKGPKKVGKSSFARTLVNRLLSQHNTIAYLDLDPGQSEFTPAGLIALTLVSDPVLGPPWTHPSVPVRAHFIGAFSPKGCPGLYVEGVRDLVSFWVEDVCSGGSQSAIPLVVNTMGWAKGLGVDLMKRVQDVLIVDGVEKVSNTLSLLFSAADQRTMNIMSYFHAVFPSSSSSSSSYTAAFHWDASLPLLARPPYQVDVGRALDRVFLLGGGGEVIRAEIDNVLGGAVVALVRCEPGTLDAIDDNDSTPGQNQLGEVGTKIPYFPSSNSAPSPSYPSPSTSSAVGLALVRSVAPGGSHLHVLTPLPLTGARVLVKGEMEIPIWGMVDFRRLGGRGANGGEGDEQRDIPYLQWEKGVGVGAERRRVRRNLMRKGQGV